MSDTLTWANSGLFTKTGTTDADLINDIVSAVGANSANSDFSWEVASSDSAASDFIYVALKRKDGSDGRIFIFVRLSGATYNSVLINGVSSVQTLYVAYFPAGNVDTPSNVTSASGTIFGDDTGAIKLVKGAPVANAYNSTDQLFYFDSYGGVVFGFYQQSTITYAVGAGELVVDYLDNAYPCAFGTYTSSFTNISFTSVFTFATDDPATESSSANVVRIRVNYIGNNKYYFEAFEPTSWANVAPSSTDILTDSGDNEAWFVPIILVGQTPGEGMPLKLRQIAHGPGSTSPPFDTYDTTGPVTQAIQFNPHSTVDHSAPWFVNFKI